MRSTTATRGRWQRLLGVMFLVVVVGLVSVGAMSGAVTADHADTTDNRIQVVDAYEDFSTGNTTVAVEATTTDSVSDLQFIHNNETDVDGPLKFSNGGIIGATYDNGTSFTSGDSFNSQSGDNGIVQYTLNQSWESGQVEINASAEGSAYDTADQANRSVLTANAYDISLEDAGGGTVTSVTPTAVLNSSSGTLHTYSFVSGGSDTFHCGGVLDGSTCTDPDTTGSAHTYNIRWRKDASPLPSSISVKSFDLATANGSSETTLTGSHTLTLDEPTAPVVFDVRNYTGGDISYSEIRVENRTTGETVQKQVNSVTLNGPLFLSPKTDYDIVVERSDGTTIRRPTTFPTKGFRNQLIRIDNGSWPPTEEVVGQVLNESGDPVANVTVSAEPPGGGQPPAFNSTTTNENGVFQMQLPQSRNYQFHLASSQTDGGTLTYFPTRDDGNGNGYRVRTSRLILPPLEIQQGGEVDINVTNASGGELPVDDAFTSLSQTTTATGDRTRSSLVESFGLFSFSDRTPNSSVVRLPSPTTGTQDDVSYNVWGPIGTTSHVCANQLGVSQGTRSNSDCELESAGTLNITLSQYESIVQQSNSINTFNAGDAFEYRRNALIVRNATTGNVTTYLGPSGIQQYFAAEGGSTLSLPVPAGNYTVELRPARRYIDRTAVRNQTTVEVLENQGTQATLKSGRDFLIGPNFDRTDETLRRTADNTIAVEIRDPSTEELLNGTQLNASVRLYHLNETVASSPASLSYNSTAKEFDNTTYTPDVSAGEYVVELRATHEDGNSTYNTTIRERLVVSDFATEIQTNQQTVEPGNTFTAGLRAYNLSADPAQPIDASSNNITLTLYDRAGNALSKTNPSDSLTNGESTIEMPQINSTGIYRIGVSVTDDSSGKQGIDDTWIRVSGYDLEVDVNKSVYKPNDTVKAEITLTETSTGNSVSGATLETTVVGENGPTTLTNTTDSNGEKTLYLDPADLFATNEWDGTTFMEVEAAIDTATGITRVRGGKPIRVRSFQTDVSPAQEQYQSGENPVIDVAVPTGTSVDSVTANRLNGKEINVSGTKQGDGFYQIKLNSTLSDYGVASQGEFRVNVKVADTDDRTATDATRFEVSSLNLRADSDSRSYAPSEDVTVTADVRYPNGSAAGSQSVTMELYEGGSNPVSVDTNTTSTGADGSTTAKLSPDSSGIHEVVVSAGGSERAFPVLVSDVSTNFTDGSGTVVDTYEFTPGQSGAEINISAKNQSGPIDGEMIVFGVINGERKELGSSDVTDGTAGISFPIPSSANTGSYPVEVFVRSESGNIDSTTASIELTGSVSIETDAEKTVYAPGDEAQIQATVTKAGSPRENKQVEFAIVSGSTEEILGSGTTSADGTVTIDGTIPSDLTDGEYGIRATLPSSGKTAFDGIYLSDISLTADTNKSAYTPGNNITVNLSATTDGSSVSSATGGVRLRLADGSTVSKQFDRTAQTAPYEVEIEVPEDDAAIGSRSVQAFVRNGSSVATASTSVNVFNASEDTTLTVPETITANETAFTVSANATVDTSGTLTVFSPGTRSTAYTEELSLNETTSLSLSDPGVYVFQLSVPGVGTETVVRDIGTGPNDPQVYVGDSLSTNTTDFATDDDIYIRTGSGNMTAEVYNRSSSFTIPLNRDGGEGSYGVLSSSDTSNGPYLVRLDGPNSTDVDSVIIEVGS